MIIPMSGGNPWIHYSRRHRAWQARSCNERGRPLHLPPAACSDFSGIPVALDHIDVAHDFLVMPRHQRLLLVGGAMGDDGLILEICGLLNLERMLLSATTGRRTWTKRR